MGTFLRSFLRLHKIIPNYMPILFQERDISRCFQALSLMSDYDLRAYKLRIILMTNLYTFPVPTESTGQLVAGKKLLLQPTI
jgi:hypothetical protein